MQRMSESLFTRLEYRLRVFLRDQYPNVDLLSMTFPEVINFGFEHEPEFMSRQTGHFIDGLTKRADLDAVDPDRRHAKETAAIKDQDHFGLLVRSAYPKKLQTFYKFRERPRFPRVQEAANLVQQWVNGNGPGILVLSGPPGTGKTHLLQAALVRLIQRKRPCFYFSEGQFLKQLHKTIESNRVDDFMAEVEHVPWLLIDELGAPSSSPWYRSMLDELVNIRWEESDHLRTLFATNLLGNDLPPRIASRLRDVERAVTVAIEARDYRLDRGKKAE